MYYTRSKARTGHKAAGVLPFSIHEGSVLVLLGAEPCKTGPGGKVWRTMWRDFGGCREAADADSAATAAREFAEETLGLFGTCAVDQAGVSAAAAAMEGTLRDEKLAVKVVHSLRAGSYHFYVTQTPWLAPLMFRLATQQNAATGAVAGAEKSAFAWVPMRALLQCVAASAPRYFLDTRAHVCGSPATPPAAKCGTRRFQLHPCFATSLRMAQWCGLEELLAAAHELPLPPPPPLPLPLPPLLLVEPAASAPVAALEAADAAGTAAGSDAEEDGSQHGAGRQQHESLLFCLGQWAALRGSAPAADAPPDKQQACGGVPPSPRATLQPAASCSSLGRSASVDTASSLRQHREAVAAAAVGQVVQQIEHNSQLKPRPSRKQRQKLRRRKLRAAEATATAAAAAELQRRQLAAAAVDEAREELPPPPPLPRHWAHAMSELQSAFQPHMRLRKRLRLEMGGAA